MLSRNERQSLHMLWTDNMEVPAIEGRELGLTEPLGDGEHGGLDETKR